MKKIFTLFLGALIALSAAAAPASLSTQYEKKTATKQLFGAKKVVPVQQAGVKKAAPFKDPAQATFAIAINPDSLTAVSARVDITPSDASALYYFTIVEKAVADTMADATIAENIKSTLDYYIMMYYYLYQLEYTYADFLSQGVDGYTFKELSPATAYTAIAMQLDGETCALIGDVARQDFSTLEIVPSGDTIQVVVDGLKWNDKYFAEEGWWQIAGYFDDSTSYISLSNIEAEQIEGTYDFVEDMDPDYSLLYLGEEQINFASGEIVVSANDNGTYHVEAYLTDVNGDVYHLVLDSKLATVSENVITMAYDATNLTLNITTTNNDPYFFYVESQDEYDAYESDFSQASLIEEIGAWINTMQQYQVLSYYTFSGNQAIDLVEFFGSSAATDDYVALAAPIEDADVNGTAAYLQFHFDAPEGIENVVLTEKAQKVVVDGVVYVVRDNKMFNVLGTQVR